MKFIVDGMLGKLARRLRILGYDTFYDTKATDEELIEKAKKEERVLLTRDTPLSRNWRIKTLLIKDFEVEDQLKQVVKAFNLKPDKETMFSRCTLCNDIIKEVAKEKVKGKVPPFVFQSYDKFWQCQKCKQIYWMGSHFEKLSEEFKNL